MIKTCAADRESGRVNRFAVQLRTSPRPEGLEGGRESSFPASSVVVSNQYKEAENTNCKTSCKTNRAMTAASERGVIHYVYKFRSMMNHVQSVPRPSYLAIPARRLPIY